MESGSGRKARRSAPPEFDRLELAVRHLLDAHDAWRSRAEAAEARVRELEQAVREVADGLDPVALADQVQRLETRNHALRSRMDAAHETVQRIVARLQFVEEER
jgi:chromosome segregation ATPase